MAAHRYWRVLVTKNNSEVSGYQYVTIMELGLRTSIGGSSVATGGTASASSEAFGWVAANAFDGTTSGNGWIGSNDLVAPPQWLKYDFGSGNDKDIVEFKVATRSGAVGVDRGQWPRDFALQYSDNNSTWTTLIEVGGETDWDQTSYEKTYSANDMPNDSGVANRFWRLRATAVDGGGGLAFDELEMYASSPTNQCTGGQAYSSSLIEGSDLFAFDGIPTSVGTPGTYWSTYLSTTGWIGYKFATTKAITAIGVRSRVFNPEQAPKDFVLEYWDGSAYQTAFTITGASGWTGGQTRYFDSTGEIGSPPAGSSARTSDFFAFL